LNRCPYCKSEDIHDTWIEFEGYECNQCDRWFPEDSDTSRDISANIVEKDRLVTEYKITIDELRKELYEAICCILDIDRGLLDTESEEKYVKRLEELEAM